MLLLELLKDKNDDQEKLKDLINKNELFYQIDNDRLELYGNNYIFVLNYKYIKEILQKYNPKVIELNYVDSSTGKVKNKDVISSNLEENLKKLLGLKIFDREEKGSIKKAIKNYGGWITSEGYIVLPEMMHRDYIMYKLGTTKYSEAFKNNFVRFISNQYQKNLGLEGTLTGLKSTFSIWGDYALNADKIYIDLVNNDGDLLGTKIIETSGISKRKLYDMISSLKNNINESGRRLYSAITINEVPEKYKKYKLLNRGTTSLIYDYSPDEVLVLTKDSLKYEWLKELFGEEVKYIEEIEPKYHPKFGKIVGNKIDVFTMPKLMPLTSEDKKKVRQFIRKFYDEFYKNYNLSKGERTIKILRDLIDSYKFEEFNKELEKLYNFLLNYDPESFESDFQLKNFMRKSDGKIIFLDPIVDKEIIDFYNTRIR